MHRAVQSQGREEVFASYRIHIAITIRDYGLRERKEAPIDRQQIIDEKYSSWEYGQTRHYHDCALSDRRFRPAIDGFHQSIVSFYRLAQHSICG